MRVIALLTTFIGTVNLMAGPESPPGNLAEADPPPSLTRVRREHPIGLAEHGITFSGSEVAEVLANVHGGKETGAIVDGLLSLALDIDTAKLIGWPNATLHASMIYPHGASASQKYVGDLGGVSNLDAYDSLRLYEAWLEQSVFDQHVSLRLGFLAADTEFCVVDSASVLINSSFGTPETLTGNFAMSTYPYSALGARVRIEPNRQWSVMLAAYDGNVAPGVFRDPTPNAAFSNESNHWGSQFALRRAEGAMLFGEVGWKHQGEDADDDNIPLSGSIKVGGAYHTDRFGAIDARTRTSLGTPTGGETSYRGNYALYAIADHEIWREPNSTKDGLSAFTRFTYTPPSRNLIHCSLECGLTYRGLCQSDARDALALGVVWFGLSPGARDAYHHVRHQTPHDEETIELTYQYALRSWWSIQPDFQWVRDPGGFNRDALVIGLRSSISF